MISLEDVTRAAKRIAPYIRPTPLVRARCTKETPFPDGELLLKLTDDAKRALIAGEITAGHARALLGLRDRVDACPVGDGGEDPLGCLALGRGEEVGGHRGSTGEPGGGA